MALSSPTIFILLVVVVTAALWGANFWFGSTWEDAFYMMAWIVAQWIPLRPDMRMPLEEMAWRYWEEEERSLVDYHHFPFRSLFFEGVGTGSRVVDSSTSPSIGGGGRGHQQQRLLIGRPLPTTRTPIPLPTVDVQLHGHHLLSYLEETYGIDWRKRPLLLRNLWSATELLNPHRRLSLAGLLREDNFTIPYFTDARRRNALAPDAEATVAAIVTNMTTANTTTTTMTTHAPPPQPYKIATQRIVEQYPELIKEIAPPDGVLTLLFGDHFTPEHVVRAKQLGPYFSWLPALTTVPLFVASTYTQPSVEDVEVEEEAKKKVEEETKVEAREDEKICELSNQQRQQQPFTALHCEPIGNIAVQLVGAKRWTMVDPVYSFLLRPSTAPDGRAYFFANWWTVPSFSSGDCAETASPESDGSDDEQGEGRWKVPYYTGITQAGDAMWVPTWTWHRVDYIGTTDTSHDPDDKDPKAKDESNIAIGASLFHFRPKDFWVNNPLFAVLMIPALVLELVGYKTQ